MTNKTWEFGENEGIVKSKDNRKILIYALHPHCCAIVDFSHGCLDNLTKEEFADLCELFKVDKRTMFTARVMIYNKSPDQKMLDLGFKHMVSVVSRYGGSNVQHFYYVLGEEV